MKKLFILVDRNLKDNDKSWLTDGLRVEGYESIPVGVEKTLSILSRQGVKGKMLRLYLELKQIICTLHKSNKDDVILVWGHQESLLINMISKFYGGGEINLNEFSHAKSHTQNNNVYNKKSIMQ